MNGEIAQYVALVCHGNAFLDGREIPDLLATNSSCQFCASITFDGAGSSRASNPNRWLQSLRDDGVYGFRLFSAARNDPRFPDRMTAGFSGGGSFWTIEAVKRDGSSDLYTSRWTVGDRDSPERRIWQVSYPRIATQKTVPSTADSLEGMTALMTEALEQIMDFAQGQRYCQTFIPSFRRALDCLKGTTAEIYHQDLFPADSLSPEATSLLHASQAAWVFGGMGSWNDMGFEVKAEQAVYDAVSNRLYNAINESIPVAVNDSFRRLQ